MLKGLSFPGFNSPGVSQNPFTPKSGTMPLEGHGFILSDLIPSKAPLEPISNLNYQEGVGEEGGGALSNPLRGNLKDTQIEFVGAAQTLKWDSPLKSPPPHKWVLLFP